MTIVEGWSVTLRGERHATRAEALALALERFAGHGEVIEVEAALEGSVVLLAGLDVSREWIENQINGG